LPQASASSDPRLAAARILGRVASRGAWAARLLSDAAPLTRELVLGSLRWQAALDAMLERACRRPLASLDPAVLATLRLGLYEARRLDTPVAVAVAEAVRVAKTVAPRAAGLVNAVLRRAVGASWPEPDDERLPLALRTSHPDWLVTRWCALLGEQAARAALLADQQPAPLALYGAEEEIEALRRSGCKVEPHPEVAGSWLVRAGAEQAVAAVRAGRVYAIDPTAVAVARLVPDTDGLIVDLAAAPGGKSLVLRRERAAARHLALDRHAGRVGLMRRNLKQARGLAVGDGTTPPLRPASCAAVLLDAPCSGTGTLRRHPEIRWRLQLADLAGLAAAQRLLAAAAAALLVPGGVLVYATCSLEPEENTAVVAGLGLEPLAAGPLLPDAVPRIELPNGGVVIPPSVAGDGFTAFVLRRPA
jgi:16S rRNA (cytosine967-C5)-methyltransferase